MLEGVLVEKLSLHLLVLVVEVVHGIVVSVEVVGLLIVGLVLLEVIESWLPDLIVREGSFLRDSEDVVVVLLGNPLEEIDFANFKKEFQGEQRIRAGLVANPLPGNVHLLRETRKGVILEFVDLVDHGFDVINVGEDMPEILKEFLRALGQLRIDQDLQ